VEERPQGPAGRAAATGPRPGRSRSGRYDPPVRPPPGPAASSSARHSGRR
jgi:hypothetical protein